MNRSLSRRQVIVGSAAVATTVAVAGFAGKPTAAAVSLIPQAALKDDLALWRLAVLQRHPRFFGQTKLDAPTEAAFMAAQATIGSAMTHGQAFRIFARVNPFFRDAHTLLMPWLSGAAPTQAETQSQFPFGIDVSPSARLLLRSGWKEEGTGRTLAKGSEILAINGVSSSKLLTR